jgi:outer membrane protein OmpA-like peptidoglycan-associated protein/tetratricopeptide (TPR) repeat protein
VILIFELRTMQYQKKRTLRLAKITLLVLGCLCTNAFTQNIEFTKENFKNDPALKKAYQQYFKKGLEYYYADQILYSVALDYFLKTYEQHKNSSFLNYLIADCYLHTQEKFKALQYIIKAVELNPSVAYNVDYVMGAAYHQEFEMEKALFYLNKFKNAYKTQDADPDTLKMVDRLIEQANNGQSQIEFTDYEMVNLGNEINTPFSEYVPLITADNKYLIFTARKPKEHASKKTQKMTHFYYSYDEDIFRSVSNEGKWTTPIKYGLGVNKEMKHDACVSLSVDGQTIFTYRGDHNGDLYYQTIENGKWSSGIPLNGVINSTYRETHISLAYDGKTAYLVSDRPGGFGGLDIWKVTKTGDTWDVIENLGPEVNTPYNEDGVFIHPDGTTIYFSSQGHNSMGGYDIFETNFEDGKWTKPTNMGRPINSADDDIYFVLTADGKNAYLSSAKPQGMGMQDIYNINPFEKKKFKDFHLVLFKGIVVDKNTREKLSAKVDIVDNEKGTSIFSANVDPELGFVLSLPAGKNYGIAVEREGYLFYSDNFIVEKKSGYREYDKVVELEKIQIGAVLRLKNVFFDFDKSELKQESTAELNRLVKLLGEYPNVKIQLEGHTDSYGSDEYNQALSERRVIAVKEYLISHGVPAATITGVIGFGESKPIDTNDTDEGRANNRRVELRIVE